ncbi:CLL_collapsed_G0004940.mRNA.1.CDS.1 [Saccharomyces cerevisiae]|nr:BEM_HP_G0121590.mRNA.1.CDS.1 [Saccharomyces cerevisiae]CAI5016624.1 AVN_HP_G0057940.mRNA.1.CDS.1 [Saccharomyces cerevisiae]CAI5228385.1 CLL_HP2_G0004620.mRNA.1.CDS.1 [Saccharomyces cerevisiae]CAI6378749.1 CLL_HP2_G0004620.mRNA.1.CDS.1 [Saccharomyces cerevisiae]CAI6418971.1 BEM_HP_G0121590.mRNA.1.CDS.1 [Saccharomyces cerevisiae]
MQIKNIVAVLATVTAINAQVGIEPNATTPNATQPNATQPNATQPNATQPNTTLPTASVTTTVSIGEAVVNTMAAGAFGAAIAAGVAFLF